MTESNKERRVRVANDIRVKASPIRMPLADFNDRYRGRQVIGSFAQREQIEKVTQEMFCDECMKSVMPSVADGPTEGTLLHVTIEDDPLRNFWKLATMRCYHCGFQEHVPLETPQFSPDDIGSGRNIAGSLLRSGSFTAGPTLAPDPYMIELSRLQEERAQQIAQTGMAQQQAMQQALANNMGLSALQGLGALGSVRSTATETRMKMEEAQKRAAAMAQRADKHLEDAMKYAFGPEGINSVPAEKRGMIKRLLGIN